MVDATPYAPLLSMADLAGNVGFYAFIDTWVGNATGHDAMYMNNVTHQCSPTRHTYGNGWALSLDLVVWPQEPAAIDTQPRSSITLASGVFGSKYPIGVVKVHEGTLAGNGADVVLDRDADFSEAADTLPVYACAGDTILYYTIPYYTILHYTTLYYAILYYTILYYTTLYYTILYYTTLCYTILCYTMLY